MALASGHELPMKRVMGPALNGLRLLFKKMVSRFNGAHC